MQGPPPQPFHQLQMLNPQHQQQLMLAQQNHTSPSSAGDDSRRLRMLLNNRSLSMGKDGLSNSVGGDVIPNLGSPLQAGLPRDPEMLLKVCFSSSVDHICLCTSLLGMANYFTRSNPNGGGFLIPCWL